jgi:hydrogenase nickel incorporation protein HypA/HybF
MHEFSVMTQIVDSILSEAKKRNAKKIEQVDLQIGEYTMLGDEQMSFAFEVLSKDSILEKAKLEISHVPGRIKCTCGYDGPVPLDEDSHHRTVPIMECPKCKRPAKITEGRECLVRNIRMVVPDV